MSTKIVFVINHLQRGGAAKMIKYVANLATRHFDEVILLSLFDTSYSSEFLFQRVKVVGLGFSNINRYKRNFLILPAIRNAINELKPNCVCSFISHVCVMTRLATIGLKEIKVISAERGDPYTQPRTWKFLIKWAFNNSDYCFFQLNKARDFFGDAMVNKSFVIPNPYVSNVSIEPYFGPRKKTIVSAGRFCSEKCYGDLIEAFANVHQKHPEYRLILYGEGPLLEEYKRHVKTLNIEKYVSFPGYVDSVSSYIQQDGMFVLSSLYEGIPNSLIEAMSVGLPCIATNCTPGGPDFLFDTDQRGVLVPVRNISMMTDAINRYIEDPDFASLMGRKAIEVLEKLSESKITELWNIAFRKIINNLSYNEDK